ncbi:MAG: hypothetical protein IPM92_17270 [Saprospiraceae bacterium]|nr:hypothetical protein [Saprospiraceae bacterium]MBK9110060.1 hypothetical protein [Saprospiraceae bacterium]
MWLKVIDYSLYWRIRNNKGEVWLTLENQSSAHEWLDTATEFNAIADLLRNEKPVYYETERGYLGCGWEPTGEGEKNESPFVLEH